ncbi:hypothetical protein CsatA_017978 [Cannabis sativa]
MMRKNYCRKCRHCQEEGHNSRTCKNNTSVHNDIGPNKFIRLFGSDISLDSPLYSAAAESMDKTITLHNNVAESIKCSSSINTSNDLVIIPPSYNEAEEVSYLSDLSPIRKRLEHNKLTGATKHMNVYCDDENIVTYSPRKRVKEHLSPITLSLSHRKKINDGSHERLKGDISPIILSNSHGKEVNYESQGRLKVKQWNGEEHQRFLLGLKMLGKGDWRGISTKYVKTRTPTQVASHAQKYFKRQNASEELKKRRKSIFDHSNHNLIMSQISCPPTPTDQLQNRCSLDKYDAFSSNSFIVPPMPIINYSTAPKSLPIIPKSSPKIHPMESV